MGDLDDYGGEGKFYNIIDKKTELSVDDYIIGSLLLYGTIV